MFTATPLDGRLAELIVEICSGLPGRDPYVYTSLIPYTILSPVRVLLFVRNGGSNRVLLVIACSSWLYAMPNPPRSTSLPWCFIGLQANPSCGPKLNFCASTCGLFSAIARPVRVPEPLPRSRRGLFPFFSV